jgi:DNA-binding transcriptional LysR family regulator
MSHVPLILLQTDLAVTMPRKLATYVAQFHPLHVVELGFKLPSSHYNMVWHARWDDVPSHRWMREAVAALMRKSAPEARDSQIATSQSAVLAHAGRAAP